MGWFFNFVTEFIFIKTICRSRKKSWKLIYLLFIFAIFKCPCVYCIVLL